MDIRKEEVSTMEHILIHHDYCDAIEPGPELGAPTKPCNCGAVREYHTGALMQHFVEDTYSGACRCSWRGEERSTKKEAQLDLDQHYGLSGL